MERKILCLGVILSCFYIFNQSVIQAQTVKVDAEIRSRGEYRAGFQSPLADTLSNAAVGLLRTRINLFYSSEKITAKITLQDSRVYGQTGINTTNNSLGLYEAYGSYHFTPYFSATIGRQLLEYDDKRILSASNWSNTGNAHDLVLFKYQAKNGIEVHLGTAWSNASDVLHESVYTVDKSYKMMNYIWASKGFGKTNISTLWLNDAFQQGETPQMVKKLTYRNTIGANIELKDKAIPYSFYLSGYYQFGHNTENASLRAYLLSLKNQYSITDKWIATLGSDYFSGSEYDLVSGKDRTFNKLYGVNHSFNGAMEYWTTLPTQGLWDLYGGLTFVATSKLNFETMFHSFSVSKKLSSTSNKNIGSELDITVNYTISPEIAVQGGASVYFATKQTDIIKQQGGVDTKFPYWGYLMLAFKPTFFVKE
ncbi:MAG: alginate export family protein [Dysgonomonas sp.]